MQLSKKRYRPFLIICLLATTASVALASNMSVETERLNLNEMDLTQSWIYQQ